MLRDTIDSTSIAAYDVIIAGTSFAALPLAAALSPGRRVLCIEGGAGRSTRRSAS